ncbi:MAG: MATE family efflux transporter [Anaerococcus sp.]|uniref:MATE family efflux transporter n=1 Tax=Anaerococcus sp. TaxID=1872515 RepID=UPI0025BC2B05|nr:MATE family efflux transporter [Anaerococcus sp.]MCI5971450.1 MATE family efflux transporter [Anaerococcus sp.]MDD6918095.1 MATE family efflux transporter [Peptoniphilaceae bacterium]MDY2927154.1 MATE family efflux transporter [Anaerococcus sp.]
MNQKLDLTRGPIWQTLVKLSIPLALTAFIQIAYGFVDMIWISRLGTDAVAGVGIAGFVFWIANSLALIPKVGTGVFASQSYGQGSEKETIRVINNGIIQAVILGFSFTIFVLIIRNIFIEAYHLGDAAEIAAKRYLFIVACGMIFFFINPMFSQSFTALGDSISPFKINAVGLLANMILDPVLIFGFGPLPALGIRGAAIATIFSQFLVSLCFLFVIIRQDDIIKKAISRIDYRMNWQKEIFKLGLPAGVLSGFHASISMILNRFMASFGPVPVAVASIGAQLESISWNTTEGIQVGIQALVGQNYGAKKIDRVIDIIKVSFKLVASIGLIASLVLFFFRYNLFALFTPGDSEAISLGADYLLILSLSQLMMATEIGLAGAFNGLSDTKTPALIGLVMNTSRIPISLILMPFLGVHGVWIAMSLSSNFKGILAIIFLSRKVKKLKNENYKEPELD